MTLMWSAKSFQQKKHEAYCRRLSAELRNLKSCELCYSFLASKSFISEIRASTPSIGKAF